MQDENEDVKSRQVRYLCRCLEAIEKEFCKGNEPLAAFYRECLSYLGSHDKLQSGDLAACDKHTHEDKKLTTKAYRARLEKLSQELQSKGSRLRPLLRDFNLTRQPILSCVVGQGNGNQSYYQLTVENEGEGTQSGAQQDNTLPLATYPDTAAEVPTQHNEKSKPEAPTMDPGLIYYRTNEISRAPWYLRVADPLFRTQLNRMRFAASLMAMYFLVLPGLIVYLFLLKQHTNMTLFLFAGFLALYLFTYAPSTNLLRLFTRKIVLLDAIRLPVSSICISEITKIPAEDDRPANVERSLSVVTVAADCPVCFQLYGVRDSVLLEQKGLLNSWIYGACTNNPMMHRFTFDKDLMTGLPISPKAPGHLHL
ncbi:hypothetical protein [Marinobacterium aestuarii]|nr:hypothetical protein [Marinobacterium aestuarii]